MRMSRILTESEGTLVPLPMSRASYAPDVTFLWTDASQRAVTTVFHWFDLKPGALAFGDRELTVAKYRGHPGAIRLTTAMSRWLTPLNIPDGGEVMYVVKKNYEIVIASRAGNEKHLPHPTLVGGDDPEVVSAGIVELFQGRISRVHINASGHFKPNSLSSVEVSLGLFCRLPARTFHAQFGGFTVFGTKELFGLPFVPGGGQAPFFIMHHAENRTPRGRTQALDLVGPRESLLAITDSGAKLGFDKRMATARRALAYAIAQGEPPPFPYSLFFDKEMHKWYRKAVEAVIRAQKSPYSNAHPMQVANTDSAATILFMLVERAMRALWGRRD